jgi:hypothetical protein
MMARTSGCWIADSCPMAKASGNSAALHDARLELSDNEAGLRVTVTLASLGASSSNAATGRDVVEGSKLTTRERVYR